MASAETLVMHIGYTVCWWKSQTENHIFFVGVIVIQIAINVAGGIGTYSGVLSNLPT
jgi:hypothetical protein